MNFKIVTDSSSDIIEFVNAPFASAPLKILTDEMEYIDSPSLDVDGMVNDLSKYKGKSSTSCPNPDDWVKAFGDAERVFCVTITGTLSGSYNAAKVAKELYEDMHPDRKVFVLNSLTTGPEMKIIIERISELVSSGLDFEDVCEQITEYSKQTGLIFILESMRNLANNGRVNTIVAKTAGLLGIRVIGKASDKGDLQQLDKCRGSDKTLSTVVSRLKEFGHKKGKIRIAHCFNPDFASQLKEKLTSEVENLDVEVYSCRGLCSFYAEKGGLLIGFEKC